MLKKTSNQENKMSYQMSEKMQQLFNEFKTSDNDNFWTGENREIAGNELVRMINENNVNLEKYNIEAKQFEFDGEMHVKCGKYGQWEIVIWCDGVVQATTFDDGLFDPVECVPLFDVLNNAQLLIDNLESLIEDFCEYRECEFDDLVWDENGDWGYGCWVPFDDDDRYC